MNYFNKANEIPSNVLEFKEDKKSKLSLREQLIAKGIGAPVHRSNVEIMEQLMNYSKFGAMSQVFIMAAIQSYAGTIIEGGRPTTEDNTAFISPMLWFDLAKDTQDRITAMYKENNA